LKELKLDYWKTIEAFEPVRSICGATPKPCTTSTFDEAEIRCAALGARLCTAPEIKAKVAKNTGCDLEYERIWITSSCARGVYGGGGRDNLVCVSTGYAFVRCCSDGVV
jgi:hypothetical protein